MHHNKHHIKHHLPVHSTTRRLAGHKALLSSAFRLALTLASITSAQAHITLPPGGAHVGTNYTAAFRVGHACAGAQSTTGITVRAPAGLRITDVPPHEGWTVQREGQQVRWTPNSPANALPVGERTAFVVTLALPTKPTTLWFKVLQQCDRGQADWAEVPGVDGAAEKPAFPAARLDVLPRGVAAVDAKLPWVRPAVAGQGATGMFVKLSAPSGARLIGASTPLAETVEVHMMKMEDNIMRMRALPDGLDLPAGQTVELAPGSYHLMLFKPRQAMPAGSTVPITLTFRDPDGKRSSMTIDAPVRATPPDAPAPMHGQPASAPAGTASGMASGMAH